MYILIDKKELNVKVNISDLFFPGQKQRETDRTVEKKRLFKYNKQSKH